MTALSIIISIAVVGVVVWAIGLVPMPAKFHMAIRVVAVLALLLWLLNGLGVMGAHGVLNQRLHC